MARKDETNMENKEIKLRTKEEYLIDFEKKLVDNLNNLFKSANSSLNYIFIIIFIFVIIYFSESQTNKINLLGIFLDLNKEDLILWTPILIYSFFISLLFDIISIISTNIKIYQNSTDILNINRDAKPILINDLDVFKNGVIGSIFLIAENIRQIIWREKTKKIMREQKPILFPRPDIELRKINQYIYELYSIEAMNSNYAYIFPFSALLLFGIPFFIVGIFSTFNFYYTPIFEKNFYAAFIIHLIFLFIILLTYKVVFNKFKYFLQTQKSFHLISALPIIEARIKDLDFEERMHREHWANQINILLAQNKITSEETKNHPLSLELNEKLEENKKELEKFKKLELEAHQYFSSLY
jgi:hypothetical protein